MAATRRVVVDLSDRLLTPTQWAFLSDRTSRIKALLGGLGSGKTSTGAEAFIDLVLASPGCNFLMVGPTHQMTNDLCLPAFQAASPDGLITKHHKSDKTFWLRGGRVVKYGSADKPASLEGHNIAAFWGDEARYWPSASWRNVLARLREKKSRRLQGILTSTPAAGWLEDEFGPASSYEGRRAYSISTRENAHNLADGYIADLRKSYSKRLAESLIEGRFGVLAGQVYEEFDADTHVIDWEYDNRHPLWLSWDFGIRAASILFAQVVGDFGATLRDGRRLAPGSVVVFDEMQTEQKATTHQMPLVRERLAGRRPHRVVCDPAGKQRSQETGMQNVGILVHEFGHGVVTYEEEMVHRHIPNRIARVGGALAPVEGEPTLYFARSLTRHEHGTPEARRGVVRSMRGTVYPEREGKRTSDLPKEDELEHARDTLEYLVVRAQNEQRAPASGAGRKPTVTFGRGR